tara:strand:+ start:1439 stop:2455 length:1017 start_codon:yes stop_codon:yes gene_type:complete
MKKNSYYHFIISELKNYSHNLDIYKRSNPLLLKLEDQKFSIYIQYMNSEGGYRTNKDETRIQITRAQTDEQLDHQNDGFQPIFLGFYTSKVFQAWDPDHVLAFQGQQLGSQYARWSNEQKVNQFGPTYYTHKSKHLNKMVQHPVLPMNDLCGYLLNFSAIHKMNLNQSESIRDGDLKTLLNSLDKLESSLSDEEKLIRHQVTVNSSRTTYYRDPKFKEKIMEQYNNSCAICGRQMDIIEAAHIIPHSKPDSNDEVGNGIALCVMHHKLYDKEELIFIDVDNQIRFNNEKIDFYREMKLDGGLDEILQQKTYSDPNDISLKPSSEFIEISKKYRLDYSH